MSHRTTTMNVAGPSLPSRLLVFVAIACLAAAIGVGCDSQEIGVDNDSTNDVEENQNQNQNQNQNAGENVHEHDAEYYEAHGPDDDEVLVDAGSLQGSWRAAFDDGNVPLAYFDIFHDEGESTADGDFLMGIAVSHMQDGTSGSIESVSIDGENVEVRWNPTDAQEEMYILELVRDDDDSYTGTFRGEMYPDEHSASMAIREID